jgi:cysteinyl-tRNA synthetase
VRATENIQEMIDLIETLIKKSVAYVANDGVYISIAKIKDYGQLAGLHIDDSGNQSSTSGNHGRIANDEYDKDNPRDFAVWKFKSKDDGDVSWPAPFGEGRPGWHIECSSMAMKYLGETFDVHTGGSDLIFPHHTNEIAQSESATGKKFANYWVHGGFMTIKEEKMAKSKGNVIKLEDLDAESLSPLAYRYWLLTAHYRSPISFSFEGLRAAQTALIRLIETVSNYPEGGKIIPEYKEQFRTLINNDIDTPQAVALAWDLFKDQKYSADDKRATILDFDRVFGLNLSAVPKITDENIPEEVTALAEAREEARKNEDWVKADALRKEIENRGFQVRDTDSGFVVKSK